MTGPRRRRAAIPLPDPPLVDPSPAVPVTAGAAGGAGPGAAAGRPGIVLRPWGRDPSDAAADAAALAAAWSDPGIAAQGALPGRADVAAARRWIEGEPARRARGLALDLVVAALADGGRAVLGEVGLAHLDEAGRAEVGFWLVPAARGRGIATAAVRLIAGWSLRPLDEHAGGAAGLGLRALWARTAPGDERAGGVLRRAGFSRLGDAAGSTVWGIGPANVGFRP